MPKLVEMFAAAILMVMMLVKSSPLRRGICPATRGRAGATLDERRLPDLPAHVGPCEFAELGVAAVPEELAHILQRARGADVGAWFAALPGAAAAHRASDPGVGAHGQMLLRRAHKSFPSGNYPNGNPRPHRSTSIAKTINPRTTSSSAFSKAAIAFSAPKILQP